MHGQKIIKLRAMLYLHE